MRPAGFSIPDRLAAGSTTLPPVSTPAEREAAPPPSFAVIFAKTLAFMLVCGIVGPIFLVIYFASGENDLIGWMLWTGLGVTLLDNADIYGDFLSSANALDDSFLQETQ